MSFINQYNLSTYLSWHKPLDAEGVDKFLARLEELEAVSQKGWSMLAEQAYYEAFDVRLSGKDSAGRVTLSTHVACVVPAWNGTRADPRDPFLEEDERALQALSLWRLPQERATTDARPPGA
jgi:hypothetical protein